MIYFSVAYVYGGAYNKISKKWQEVFPMKDPNCGYCARGKGDSRRLSSG